MELNPPRMNFESINNTFCHICAKVTEDRKLNVNPEDLYSIPIQCDCMPSRKMPQIATSSKSKVNATYKLFVGAISSLSELLCFSEFQLLSFP